MAAIAAESHSRALRLDEAERAHLFDLARAAGESRAAEFFVDWDSLAADAVAAPRSEAGRNPYDHSLTELVGGLSARSADFRRLWAKHDVYAHTTGAKRMRHPVVGELELTFEALELATDPA